ncbi:MAG: transposase [Deltaproteobacteria bacterium]|nr:transposase [Deltaproteobacteria bacterium]
MKNNRLSKSTKPAPDIVAALCSLRNEKEMRQFLGDLLSPMEWESIQDRWRIAWMKHNGASYSDITNSTSISSTTIARVVKCLRKGKGGYRVALQRLAA